MKNVWILFILLISFSGCNIFETREAEPPDKPASWEPFPNTPEKCLENLINAFGFRENVFKYGSILSDDFVFYFDPQDVRDFTVPDKWDKQDEIDMLMNVYFQSSQTQGMRLELFEISGQQDIIHSHSALIYREYKLILENTIPNFNSEFTGQFQLNMERESNGFWIIKVWIDSRDLRLWSFGRMKNAFGS